MLAVTNYWRPFSVCARYCCIGMGAYTRRRWWSSSPPILSKESAASLAGLALLFAFMPGTSRPRLGQLAVHAVSAGVVVLGALWLRRIVADGPDFIPPIDNAMSLVKAHQRILTALWVQRVYLGKSAPARALRGLFVQANPARHEPGKSAGLGWRWAGRSDRVGFDSAACDAHRDRVLGRGVIAAANIVLPIGTTMGERLAYVPSIGIVLLMAQVLRSTPGMKVALASIALLFAVRTWQRNLDWHSADRLSEAGRDLAGERKGVSISLAATRPRVTTTLVHSPPMGVRFKSFPPIRKR